MRSSHNARLNLRGEDQVDLRADIRDAIQQSENRVVEHVESVRDQLDRSFAVRAEEIRTDCVHADEHAGLENRVRKIEEHLELAETNWPRECSQREDCERSVPQYSLRKRTLRVALSFEPFNSPVNSTTCKYSEKEETDAWKAAFLPERPECIYAEVLCRMLQGRRLTRCDYSTRRLSQEVDLGVRTPHRGSERIRYSHPS